MNQDVGVAVKKNADQLAINMLPSLAADVARFGKNNAPRLHQQMPRHLRKQDRSAAALHTIETEIEMCTIIVVRDLWIRTLFCYSLLPMLL